VVPRLLAAIITMPILVGIADAIGVLGGYVASTQSLGFNGAIYLSNTIDALAWNDINSGLIKAAVFGFIIALLGCYNGFNSKGGAQGVGEATTSAVVSSSILILAANYILTNILFAD
jgi:phospholipid/cholesterol/gamma-HCH transport system permease protein